MWLIVFAPVLSQSLAALERNTPFAPLCVADITPGDGGHGSSDHGTAFHLDACGYCDLLMHHAAAPTPDLPPLAAAQYAGTAPAAAVPVFVPREIPSSGRPRDSPALLA